MKKLLVGILFSTLLGCHTLTGMATDALLGSSTNGYGGHCTSTILSISSTVQLATATIKIIINIFILSLVFHVKR